MDIDLAQQQRINAAENELLRLRQFQAQQLRIIIRANLNYLEEHPQIINDNDWKESVISLNHELAAYEIFIADSPDHGQSYGLQLPAAFDAAAAAVAEGPGAVEDGGAEGEGGELSLEPVVDDDARSDRSDSTIGFGSYSTSPSLGDFA